MGLGASDLSRRPRNHASRATEAPTVCTSEGAGLAYTLVGINREGDARNSPVAGQSQPFCDSVVGYTTVQ